MRSVNSEADPKGERVARVKPESILIQLFNDKRKMDSGFRRNDDAFMLVFGPEP